MSLITPNNSTSSQTEKTYNLRMQVVINSTSEADAKEVMADLLHYCPNLSFSPVREQPSLNNAIEFYASGVCTEAEKEAMITGLDNDFDYNEEDDVYSAYAFNTKMWNPKVYYLEMEF